MRNNRFNRICSDKNMVPVIFKSRKILICWRWSVCPLKKILNKEIILKLRVIFRDRDRSIISVIWIRGCKIERIVSEKVIKRVNNPYLIMIIDCIWFDIDWKWNLWQMSLCVSGWCMDYPCIYPSEISEYGKCEFPRVMNCFSQINKRSHKWIYTESGRFIQMRNTWSCIPCCRCV